MTQPFFDLQKTFVQPVELVPERTAVVVVDMQYSDASADQGFNVAMDRLFPGSVDYFNERNERLTVPSIRRLLAAARERDVRVVYLTIGAEHRDLREFPARTRRWIREVEERSGVHDIFWSGAPWSAIREELAPVEGDTVVNKTAFGAFNGSDIDATLQRLGIESLVITGISTITAWRPPRATRPTAATAACSSMRRPPTTTMTRRTPRCARSTSTSAGSCAPSTRSSGTSTMGSRYEGPTGKGGL